MRIPTRKPKVAGGAARNVSAGTSSLSASGLAIQPPALDTELGSAIASRVPELVPELVSAYSRLQTYTRMMNDAGVDVSMRAAKTPVLGADYFVEPYSDNQADLDIAEFIENNLFSGMSAPFLNSLEDILHMYEDGYSVLEKCYETRNWAPKRTGSNGKAYTMLKKLAVRPSSTLTDIEYDNNGGPVQINQNAVQADKSVAEKQMKVNKLLIFTFGRIGGDLTGKSLLRTAYPHWYYKTHFYKIDAIQKERHSLGVPKGMLKPGYTKADQEVLRNLLRNLRNNEESFMVLPPNVDVEFAEIHGNLVNVLESATHHNVMILMNVMAQFLALGVETAGGGRATGGAQTDIYMKSLRYIANYIVDVINMYLIPELVVWNFPTTNFPKLNVRNLGETKDLQMLGSAISGILHQGGITMDLTTENWIRKVLDMPLKTSSNTVYDAAGNLIPPVDTTTGADTTANNGNGNNNGQKGGVKAQAGNGGNVGKSATSAV